MSRKFYCCMSFWDTSEEVVKHHAPASKPPVSGEELIMTTVLGHPSLAGMKEISKDHPELVLELLYWGVESQVIGKASFFAGAVLSQISFDGEQYKKLLAYLECEADNAEAKSFDTYGNFNELRAYIAENEGCLSINSVPSDGLPH